MKSIFFDAGPVISLATNNLLEVLGKLKSRYNGKFYFSGAVKKELIDVPFNSRKFKFEAIQIMKAVENGVFEIFPEEKTSKLTNSLLDLANNIYFAEGTGIRIVHKGEIDSIAGAKILDSEAVAIDERTTRMLIENPRELKDLLGSRLHKKVRLNEENLEKFRNAVGAIKIIRSSEIAAVSYEIGLMKDYLPKVPEAGRELLDGVLWGIKLNGCAISKEEIDEIIKIETKNKKVFK